MVDAVVLRIKITKTLGRVIFRKEFWDCHQGQAKNVVTIPETIAGHILAPGPFSFLK